MVVMALQVSHVMGGDSRDTIHVYAYALDSGKIRKSYITRVSSSYYSARQSSSGGFLLQ